MKIYPALFLTLAIGTIAGPAFARGANENAPWQNEATAEKANRADLEDLRLKRTSAFYSAPTYTATIGAQYNCSVNASASGDVDSSASQQNSGTQSAKMDGSNACAFAGTAPASR